VPPNEARQKSAEPPKLPPDPPGKAGPTTSKPATSTSQNAAPQLGQPPSVAPLAMGAVPDPPVAPPPPEKSQAPPLLAPSGAVAEGLAWACAPGMATQGGVPLTTLELLYRLPFYLGKQQADGLTSDGPLKKWARDARHFLASFKTKWTGRQ